MGIDIKNPNHFNGKIAHFSVVLGKGAFKTDNDFDKDDDSDPFNIVIGFNDH